MHGIGAEECRIKWRQPVAPGRCIIERLFRCLKRVKAWTRGGVDDGLVKSWT